MARQLNCPFYETSAVLRKCVDDVFQGLVREIRRKETEIKEAQDKQHRRQKRLHRMHVFLRTFNIFQKLRSRKN